VSAQEKNVSQGLTQEQIRKLLFKPSQKHVATQSPNNINGPLKYYDSTHRCASRGCSAPTHFKVEGVPRCIIHALNALNELIVEMDGVIQARNNV